MNKLAAEAFGTYWLVLGGCGSAVLSAAYPELGIGLLGVSLAFGLSVLTMAYAVGGISGGHFNPAVSFGLLVAGKLEWDEFPRYVGAQCLGAVLAGLTLYLIASGKTDFAGTGGFAANGYGEHSPGRYSLFSAFLCEMVMTAFFLIIILGATAHNAKTVYAEVPAFAPLAIGLALTLIHLVSIPVTNTSVNPARSLGVALFADGWWAIGQLWLFWLAPMLGALIGAILWGTMLEDD